MAPFREWRWSFWGPALLLTLRRFSFFSTSSSYLTSSPKAPFSLWRFKFNYLPSLWQIFRTIPSTEPRPSALSYSFHRPALWMPGGKSTLWRYLLILAKQYSFLGLHFSTLSVNGALIYPLYPAIGSAKIHGYTHLQYGEAWNRAVPFPRFYLFWPLSPWWWLSMQIQTYVAFKYLYPTTNWQHLDVAFPSSHHTSQPYYYY